MDNDKRKKERTVPRTARVAGDAAQKTIRTRNKGLNSEADWSSADPERLRRTIVAITRRGCAVQFGRTRDQGAFSVRIVGDGEPYVEYVRPTEDIDLHLEGLIDDFTNGNSGER